MSWFGTENNYQFIIRPLIGKLSQLFYFYVNNKIKMVIRYYQAEIYISSNYVL